MEEMIFLLLAGPLALPLLSPFLFFGTPAPFAPVLLLLFGQADLALRVLPERRQRAQPQGLPHPEVRLQVRRRLRLWGIRLRLEHGHQEDHGIHS